MKNFNLVLIAALFSIIISSCGKDDPQMQEIEETAPFFKATFDWDAEFLATAGVTNASDSVPLGMDLSWDADLEIDINLDADFATVVDVAVIYEEGEDAGYYTLAAVQLQGTDTVIFSFSLYGAIEEKTYSFASLDLLGGLFEEEMEPPAGTVIPLLLSLKSEAAITPALMTVFGAADFTGSEFSITSYDQEKNEVSGTFNVNYKIPASDGDPEVEVMNVVDGEFGRVKVQ